MKTRFSRVAGLLTALALCWNLLPVSFAQSAGQKEEAGATEAPEQPPVLTLVGDYREGRRFITDGTLLGYVGVDGTMAIEPLFEQAGEFYLGVAQVTRGGKTGLLRWDGAYVIRPEYDELIAVDYGVYLGRRDQVWDVLSAAKMVTAEGTTQKLYSDLPYAAVYEGLMGRIVLQDQEGTWTNILISALPQILEQNRVPGWQFPLAASRRANFTDVRENDWFDRWINLVYSVDMMEGTGGGKFEPLRSLTVAETLRLAACLESRARRDDFHLQELSALWYQSSVVYCEAVGIIDANTFAQEDYSRPITRAEMAKIFATTASVRGIRSINDEAKIRASIPDVDPGDPAAEAIYQMYAKGIINGADSMHSFLPDEELTRAEAAAVIARIARPEQRISFW